MCVIKDMARVIPPRKVTPRILFFPSGWTPSARSEVGMRPFVFPDCHSPEGFSMILSCQLLFGNTSISAVWLAHPAKELFVEMTSV